MLEKNHYIQKSLLNNFATRGDNGEYKICVLDLFNFTATYKSTADAFYEKNMYDILSDDEKELEKKLNKFVESPMNAIRQRLMKADKTFTVTRRELNIIKKYLLLQIYRTPGNRMSYTNVAPNSFELSQYNIREGESKEDFWKREMLTIIETEWEELANTELVGVKKHYKEIQENTFLMFVRTNQEFCINDRGFVTERIPLTIPKAMEDKFVKVAQERGQQIYGVDDFGQSAIDELQNKNSYIDNYFMFPISSNVVILAVNVLWKNLYLNNLMPLFPSYILLRHFSLPQHNYVNKEKIHNDEDIVKYKTMDDTFTYSIHILSETETSAVNQLTINETFQYLGLKTPSMFLKTIRDYNGKKYQLSNINNDLSGFVELLSKLKT